MSSGSELNTEGLSNHELASQVFSKYTGKSTTSNNNKRKSQNLPKDDDEYIKKRQRNNVAVKKSREKAKNRIQETQVRVEQLSKENEELQTKVNLLSKELNVLRALFTNGGFTLPSELQYVNGSGSPPPPPPSEIVPPSMSYGHSRLAPDDLPPPQSLAKSPLHSSYEAEKAIYHSLDDVKSSSKIPPLRPMPRNPSSTSLSSSHSMSSGHSPLGYSKRMYSLPPKQEYSPPPSSSIKDSKAAGPPLLIQPGSQSISNNFLPQYSKGDTRHPSVIRSTTDITTPSHPSTTNMLGKFCIIKDPQDNIKVVPINS